MDEHREAGKRMDHGMPVADETCNERLCPYLVMANVARPIIEDLAGIHENPDAARGQLAALGRAADAVRGCYPCDGPVSTQDGQVRCPLAHLIADVHQLTTVPVQRPNWAFDPERLVDGDTDKSTGQFL